MDITSFLNKFLLVLNKTVDVFDYCSNFRGLIVLLIIVFLVVKLFFSFEKKQNELSQKQINLFKKNKKYFEKIYVELDETKEVLRFFIYGTKWKQKIVSLFNSLFDNQDGIIFKENIIDKKIKFYINPWIANFLKIDDIEIKMYSSFCIIKDKVFNKEVFVPKDDNTYEKFYNLGYCYGANIELIRKYIAALKSKCILIKGTAGNGKTNILCNTVQHIIKTNNPCIFINSRDINKNLKEYFLSQIQINEFLKTNLSYCIVEILNVILKIKRKNLYIVLDAINENDTEIFCTTINEFITYIRKFSNIKLIMSCRSEYFEERYSKLFKNQEDYIFIYERTLFRYPKRIKYKLFSNYKNEFNFKGDISETVFSTLVHSLLLMRIFFEVYKNSDKKVMSLNKYEIYKEYINSLKKNVDKPEILINKLIEKMILKEKFDEISIHELGFSEEDFITFKKFADENLLISRMIKKYEGTLPETEDEVFYFVFDELRDYCISKFVIKKCMDDKDFEFKSLFNLIQNFVTNKYSPVEGVVKYSYNHFKSVEDYNNCSKILSLLSTEFRGSGYSRKFRLNEEEFVLFDNFGMNMIFESNEQLIDCEFDFIQKVVIDSDQYAFSKLANYLISSDISKTAYSIDILNKILLKIEDFDVLQQKTSLYFENYEYCQNLLIELRKMGKDKKSSLLKYIAIVVLCQNENRNILQLKKELLNLDIIRSIIIETKCPTLIERAEHFIQKVKVGNS